MELVSAPGLDADEDLATFTGQQRNLATAIARALRPWSDNGSLELRYLWKGDADPGRLRVVLIGRTLGRTADSARRWARQMVEGVAVLFPAGWKFGPVEQPVSVDTTSWAELERLEEVRTPAGFVPADVVGYYYLLHPFAGSGSGWTRLAPALLATRSPGFVRIVLMPTTMTDLEREAVDHVCSVARHFSEPQQEYDFYGNPFINPADAAASDVLSSWRRFSSTNGVLARVGVAGPPDDTARISAVVGGVIAQGGGEGEDAGQFKTVSDLDEWDSFYGSSYGLVLPRRRPRSGPPPPGLLCVWAA